MVIEDINKIAIEALEEIKGLNIITIDVRKVTTITDFFIIATGTSDRHRKSLADQVEEQMEKNGFNVLSKEGYNEADWILMDFGYVVVNIFDRDVRNKFNLERLWSDGILNEIRSKAEDVK